MSLIGDITNTLTGGAQSKEDQDQQNAINALADVSVPTASELDLPALQQYAAAQQMTPAQMQAYLQSSNALNTEDVNQTGTSAQEAALSQLANVANQGAAGDATEQAQEQQILNNTNEELGGQRGAIDQAAEARGVPLGLLQAALATTNAGQDAQAANTNALQAQSNNYQTALQALANEGSVGSNLQSQQNTQANTVANAQNAMQQFNAANQQAASANNAQFQQAANAANTAANNQVSQANTGLANQQTEYNAAVPETVFGNQFEKATGQAQQYQNQSQNATQQGNQNLGIVGAGLGATSSALLPGAGTTGAGEAQMDGGTPETSAPPALQGGSTALLASNGGIIPMYSDGGLTGGVDGYDDGGIIDTPSTQGLVQGQQPGVDQKTLALLQLLGASGKSSTAVRQPGASQSEMAQMQQKAMGGMSQQDMVNAQMRGLQGYCEGGMTMKAGGMIPGKAKVPGDSKINDTVPIKVSPGEAVVPRTVVQQNPIDVMRLLAGRPASKPMPGEPGPGGMPQGHHPHDIAALLAAMKQMRGAR